MADHASEQADIDLTERGKLPAPELPNRKVSLIGRVADILLGKVATLVLTTLALMVGLATFIILARGSPLGWKPGVTVGLVLANLSVLLMLGAVLGGRLTRVWVERRRGSAGARLHVRLVLLFSGVAVAPTIVVACFAVAFFHFGIQAWFNDPVREALSGSLQVSRGYLEEHRNNIRAVALEMANDLARAGRYLSADPTVFAEVLDTQTTLRGLTEAVIYEPTTGQVLAAAGIFVGLGVEPPSASVTQQALRGDVVVLNGGDGTRVRAVVRLESTPPLMLMIGRPIDPSILQYMHRTETAVSEYQRLDENRSWLQIAFAWIFAIVALLVLLAAGLIGLVIANQIARPVGMLISAAERVRSGDLQVRVHEAATGDELAGLSRAFNRMTGQLAAQRTELMDAYSQIDERRRFTETVLSGVSAGVIGLDDQGRIELPNRTADELLGLDLITAIGRPLSEIVPEFSALFAEVAGSPDKACTAEIQIGPSTRRRTLLVRIGAELSAGRTNGYVVTFDDITELQAAQRKAAWADVARRIAHEIKNPLTPIQLSAERLKRRFAKEIQSDPETFALCADTIIRHVGDIGRMVDEFSAFARMPQPIIKPDDIGRIAREALVLQKTARPGIVWNVSIPEHGPVAPCDRRMVRQALTNLLQNAADAVSMREGAGVIELTVSDNDEDVEITVADDGIGLPEDDRSRLTEPYVTHKPKGTGLGLAIVKKIMEDHGGAIALGDNPNGPGAVAVLRLPRHRLKGLLEGDLRQVAHGA
ncbi:MAG TPA: PAS domain-containing sensor histidine kinase [Rhodopila sp.]|uniref:sensor histidine kinase NtrY-like n=1 Tax=Rhodopila sp. TaxID=2480087 RepID=UPI002B814B90|nr:PAS domain-containing sensor histidine kinase [Rhodopila sp.]HVY13714.1 PAS domain-containing sensor histidine kinase [Rhodopila sp.]